jgi:ABC-2 type transport system permease protein
MIADIWTVVWKEWKELLPRTGGLRGGRLSILLLLGVFGVFLPLQFGREWVESPLTLLFWAWVPLMLVSSAIADSFAGERERHTLETLLVSPLPDRAILLGKVAAAVGYGWGTTLAALLIALVTLNLAFGQGQLLLFPPIIAVGGFALSLLGAGLVASAGVLVSLRAASVQQAQQSLSLAIMLLLFVPVFGVQALPGDWKLSLAQAVAGASISEVVLAVAALLAALDAALLATALSRFQRDRLASE